jgi:hypothetical protein
MWVKDSAFKVNDLELRAQLRQTQLRRIGIKRKKINYYYKRSYQEEYDFNELISSAQAQSQLIKSTNHKQLLESIFWVCVLFHQVPTLHQPF